MRPAGTTAVVTGSFPAVAIAVAIVSGAAGMVGVYLGPAWHRTVGRVSFFILPPVFIYCGGLGVLGAALTSAARATLGRAEDFGGPILRPRRLRLPLGFAITALGIFVIMAAAPVDAWWHATFGKDVLIWSPPHLQLHLGAGVAAIGLLFAVAAQRGRGALTSAWLWRGAMLAVLVDLVHRGHFILAHYTMLSHARTPDLYPFLVALLVPVVLVAAARAVGPWAPTLACLLFLGVTWLMDVMLRAIEFDRYTLTPILALPAAVLSLAFWGEERQPARSRRDGAWLSVAAGGAFTIAFVTMEFVWMGWAVGRPWATERVLAGLPPVLRARRLSGGGGMGRRRVRQPVASPRRRDRRHRAGPGRSRGDLSAPALWPADARGRAQARSVLGVPVPGGDLLERGACRGMALRAEDRRAQRGDHRRPARAGGSRVVRAHRGGPGDGGRRRALRRRGERHARRSRAVPSRTPPAARRVALRLGRRRLGVPASEPEPVRLLDRAPGSGRAPHDASRAARDLQGPVKAGGGRPASGRSGSARIGRDGRCRRLRA